MINDVLGAVGARVTGETSGVDFARIVQARGEGVVSSYLNGNDPSNPHRSVKNLIEETTHEYGGRFLLELLQNAHDAHDGEDSRGQVLMWLDRDENGHGVLYVADRGRGFDDESFNAICKLAQSNKTVGEGIGNKGVGFKSVLQICEWPEIYSCNPVAPDRDGYCFRFAAEADLRRMAPDDEAFRRVQVDVSAYTVPVPITTPPKAVRGLRDQGFRTVMRFPLRSEVAAAEVEKRFVELERNSVPVMLFLRRMGALRLRRVGGEAPDTDVTLSREVQPLSVATTEEPLTAAVVTVDEQQRFFVVSRDVDPAALEAALRESVDAELLNSKWLDWTTPTHVAAAVPRDSAVEDGRLYTYLPMGPESAAPLPGHLHAPFHTDFARRSLIRDHPLNSMLFDVVAALALDANKLLLSGSLAIPGAEARSVAVDLVSWSGPGVEHLARAADRQSVLLPSATGGVIALSDAWRWPQADCEVLTPELAERAAGMACLPPSLGGKRLERLRQTARALGESIDLAGEMLAETVEAMAEWCAREQLPIHGWNALYDDIAVLFERGADARHLGGRRILLHEDRELTPCLEPPDPASLKPGGRPRSARRKDPTPFFPPMGQVTEGEEEVDPDIDLTLPRGLKDRIVLLHPELTWHDENRKVTRARSFLVNNNLVSRFDVRSLVEHVRSVLTATTGRRVHAEALRFLYALQRGGRAVPDLTGVGVRLPTVGGEWLVADAVLFSSAWPDTNGTLLESVTAVEEEVSSELSQMARRLLVPPSELLRPSDNVQDWVEFLRKLGVRDELPARHVWESRKLNGNRLWRDPLASNESVPPGITMAWKAHLAERSRAQHPGTPYGTRMPITWLPGQDCQEFLPVPAREAYAKLVLIGLSTWPDNYLEMVWERDRDYGYKDPQRVPTPLGTFVRTAAWLVVDDPRTQGQRFEVPQRTWHFRGDRDGFPPRFAPFLRRDLRTVVDDHPRTAKRLRRFGMPTWNEPDDGAHQLDHLAKLLDSGLVEANLVPALRNTYRDTWNVLLGQSDGADQLDQWLDSLIVSTAGCPQVRRVSDFAPEAPLVITEHADDDFLRQVVADFEYPVLHLDRYADTVRDALAEGAAVRPEQLNIRILLNGAEFAPTGDASLLVEELPWLVTAVVALLEHRAPPHERPGETRLAEIATTLAAIRFVVAEDVAVRVADVGRPAPARLRGVLPVPDARHPTLVFAGPPESFRMTWDLVDAAAEPVLRLVEHARSASLLRLAVSRLRQRGAGPGDPLDGDTLADACEVEPEALAYTTNHLGTGPRETLTRLRPVAHHLWGPEAAAALDFAMSTHDANPTESAVRNAVRAAAVPGAFDPDLLFEAAQRANSLDELRTALGISLAQINHALEAVSPGAPPIDYGAQHEETFRMVVQRPDNRLALLNRLRWALLDEHAAVRPIDGWEELRDLTTLRPLEEWRYARDEVTAVEVIGAAEEQLAHRVGKALPADGPKLVQVDKVREANRILAEEVLREAAPTVQAWCRKNGGDGPAVDLSSTSVLPAVNALAAVGALDFTRLDRDLLIAWLRVVRVWPAAMPASTELDQLGLTDQDLRAEKSDEERRAEEQRRARRVLDVDGTVLDLRDGLENLRRSLEESLDNTPGFLATRAQVAPLRAVGSAGSRGAQPGSRSAEPVSRPSAEQLSAIGFAGEWLAYQWLLRRYPDQVTEDSWVSTNRAVCFTGNPGDDGCGYDLEVPFRGGNRMYEVKATTGDGGEIQLGESEVRCAQENARNNRWRLLVVTHALDRSRGIIQLPNPFSTTSRDLFAFVGQGIRLRYATAD
jgi:hypothetical protein